jgi:hypothetical protein
VATANKADALATVALAVAVVAFVIQILVFVAQLFATTQQVGRSEEIYARLNGLLEGIRGTTTGTQEFLNRTMGDLLRAATGAATEAIEEETEGGAAVDQSDLQQKIAERAGLASGGPSARPAVPSANDEAIVNLLSTYPPEEEGRRSYDILKALSPLAIDNLRRFGTAERSARREGREAGQAKTTTDAWTNELQEHGLVERLGQPDESGEQRTRLTPEGRAAARLLTARGQAPDWLQTQ